MYTCENRCVVPSSCSPAHEAVVCGSTRRSYGELAERVRRVAGLLETVTEPGDRVALWA